VKRYLAVINPAARKWRCCVPAWRAIEQLRSGGLKIDCVETRRPREATDIVRRAYKEGRRDFIAVGGDGTNYELINGLFPESLEHERVTLGFLPFGTGNAFMRQFSAEPAKHSIEAILEGRSRACDVIRLTHNGGDVYYINILGFGFVADVNNLASRLLKGIGEAAYALAVVACVAGLTSRRLPIRLDGGPWHHTPNTFISVSNSRYTANMLIAPEADPSDGIADVLHVGQLGRLGLLRAFPRIFRGTHVEHPPVKAYRAQRIEFDADGPVDVTIDGEVERMTPWELEVLPGAFDVHA
jgi:diacylglycerol kinase (ATP)